MSVEAALSEDFATDEPVAFIAITVGPTGVLSSIVDIADSMSASDIAAKLIEIAEGLTKD